MLSSKLFKCKSLATDFISVTKKGNSCTYYTLHSQNIGVENFWTLSQTIKFYNDVFSIKAHRIKLNIFYLKLKSLQLFFYSVYY